MNRDRMLDRWDEVDALITRALDLPVQERQRWLEAECGDDAELLELVRSVLTREAGAGNFLSGDHRAGAGGGGGAFGAGRCGRRADRLRPG
jgi:hypothetical protein